MRDFSFLFTEALSFLRFLLVFCKIEKPLSKIQLCLNFSNNSKFVYPSPKRNKFRVISMEISHPLGMGRGNFRFANKI